MSQPLPARPSVVVVVPTYNERPNIETLVRGVLALGPEYSLVVVDDNSPDGTGQILDSLALAQPERIEVLHRPAKAGLGTAYLAGFAAALRSKPDLVAQMDADLSHDPAALADLVAMAQSHDLVIGSRYVPGGGSRGWPLWRRLLSRLGGAYARAVLGVPISDLTGGFKVWRRDLLEEIDLTTLRSDGYVFTIEATWRALQAGAQAVETPIIFTDRVAGASKLSRRIVVEAAFVPWKLRWEDANARKRKVTQA